MARHHISKLRGRKSFQRRQGQRAPRSITLIVCEGETEQIYFQVARGHFGLTTTEIVVADKRKGSAPISVVDYAQRRANEPGGYDHIFCVFDKDGHESFDRARTKIDELANRARNPLPIHKIISVPCFEIWVLLHFEKTDAPFPKCDEVAARIQRQHMKDYSKADPNVATQLMAYIEVALVNSVWLASRGGIMNDNPSTSVHKLVEHLKTVSASLVTFRHR